MPAIQFKCKIQRFEKHGEKTGWTYIEISEHLAGKLNPGSRKSFRVRGTIDDFTIEKTAVLPMGNGNFILPVNAGIRKGVGKTAGDIVKVVLERDERKLTLNKDFVACLKDDEKAFRFFNTLPKGHQAYFSKWIDGAKTEATKTRRITMALIALSAGQGYGEMIRANKASRL